MAEVINLRREAKRRDRSTAAQAATENRVRHGRTKAERASDARAEAQATERLDSLKRDENPR